MESAEALRLQGNAAFKAKNFDSAIFFYDTALQVCVMDPAMSAVILNNRSAANLKLNRSQRALDDATAAVEHDATNAKAHFRMALALRSQGSLLSAATACQRALAINPKEMAIKEELEHITQALQNGTNGAECEPADQHATTAKPAPQDAAAIAWLRANPPAKVPSSPAMISVAMSLPAWAKDQKMRAALMRGKLVRISQPFPPPAADEVARSLCALPTQLWTRHRGAVEGFQYAHHNLYLDHTHLSDHAPAYHLACHWLQTAGRAWFEQVTGRKGTVTVSASWYRPGDYSTPHNDLGRRRHIAFVWHVAMPASGEREASNRHGYDAAAAAGAAAEGAATAGAAAAGAAAAGAAAAAGWDETQGGDFVWCEPYTRFPPTRNTLYLFRVHDGSYHFVQQVVAPAPREDVDAAAGKPRRLAVNGWYVLDEDPPGGGTRSTEDTLSDEGFGLHRKLLARVLQGEEASFVHRC